MAGVTLRHLRDAHPRLFYQQTWLACHPGWELRFWAEENLPGNLRRPVQQPARLSYPAGSAGYDNSRKAAIWFGIPALQVAHEASPGIVIVFNSVGVSLAPPVVEITDTVPFVGFAT